MEIYNFRIIKMKLKEEKKIGNILIYLDIYKLYLFLKLYEETIKTKYQYVCRHEVNKIMKNINKTVFQKTNHNKIVACINNIDIVNKQY